MEVASSSDNALPNGEQNQENPMDVEDSFVAHEGEEEPETLPMAEKENFEVEDKRRLLGNMEKIEKEFADLKEKFFNEKIDALKREHEMIKIGSHQGLLKKSKELEELRDHKTWSAEKWKEYQLQNIENIYQSETKQAEEEFKADKKALKEKMLSSTIDKKKKLLEEKNTMSVSDPNDRVVTRTLRNRNGAKEEKLTPFKRRLNPPHINYTLQENEILEDIGLIQKSIANQPSYGKFPVSKAGHSLVSEVYTDKGRLFYHNQTFEKGQDVSVESRGESGRWRGIMVLVNPAEIHIRSSDGTKSRFSLSQLRNGKYSIAAAS